MAIGPENFMVQASDVSDKDFCPPIDFSMLTPEELEQVRALGLIPPEKIIEEIIFEELNIVEEVPVEEIPIEETPVTEEIPVIEEEPIILPEENGENNPTPT